MSKLKQLFILKQRFLTPTEKQLARSVFGDAIELDDIKIIAHRLIIKHYALSPNGCIYFNKADWKEDFSQQSLAEQAWFIHELVHVWQIQQGIKVIRNAIFDRQYHYVIEQGKQFLHYGIEQQAQMVQDYFIKQKTGQSCQDLAECIPFIYQNKKIS